MSLDGKVLNVVHIYLVPFTISCSAAMMFEEVR